MSSAHFSHDSLILVEYDDGDEEDYNKRDLIKGLKRYQKEGKADTNRNV